MPCEDCKKLTEVVHALATRVDAMETAGGLFARDKDLDGPRGDPVVKLDPRDWNGVRCKGKRLSVCPPEFLDEYAKTLVYFSEHPKPGKEKYAANDRADAARARSWARRLRGGWRPATVDVGEFPGDPVPQTQFDVLDRFEAPAFEAPHFQDEFEDDIPF